MGKVCGQKFLQGVCGIVNLVADQRMGNLPAGAVVLQRPFGNAQCQANFLAVESLPGEGSGLTFREGGNSFGQFLCALYDLLVGAGFD